MSHHDALFEVVVEGAASGQRSGGLSEWETFRSAFQADPALRLELENFARIVLENFNPSGRAARFIYGSMNEWGLALAAFCAGLLTLPQGHDANSTDLSGVVDQQRALWSVKASASTDVRYNFILQNFRSGEVVPPYDFPTTVFLHPVLPGITIVEPTLHSHVVDGVVVNRDARVLPVGLLSAHALVHPECVIPFQQPANQGGGNPDEVTGLDIVRGIVDTPLFTRLRTPFRLAAEAQRGDVVTRLHDIQRMIQDGLLTQDQGQAAINILLGQAQA